MSFDDFQRWETLSQTAYGWRLKRAFPFVAFVERVVDYFGTTRKHDIFLVRHGTILPMQSGSNGTHETVEVVLPNVICGGRITGLHQINPAADIRKQ